MRAMIACRPATSSVFRWADEGLDVPLDLCLGLNESVCLIWAKIGRH
jgi:hypothetical protein